MAEWNNGDDGRSDWVDTQTNGDGFDTNFESGDGFSSKFESGDARNHIQEGDDTAGGGGGCRNCGQDGHFARECPEPRKMICFNCHEEGHSKSDCPKPRVFTGTCNICSEEGHPASKCPSKPKTCGRCRAENDHETKDCQQNYYVNLEGVPDVSEKEAWSEIVKSCLENDLDDFKDALRMLQKAKPDVTYPTIEKKLRAQSLRYHLIATAKEVGEGYTLVDLQGKPEMKYLVGIFKSAECHRPMMAAAWPKNADENMTRLADAGMAKERGLPYCRTCSAFGHSTRNCEQDKPEPEGQPEIRCALCDEVGHRVRDCKEPRQKPREPRACKICESTEHIAKDCDQKPAMKCRNCEGEGHKASDCTEPKVIRCNNPDCGEVGHTMKACPKPIAYEKMVCRHCGEKGHMSASRCAPGAGKKDGDDENDDHKGGDDFGSNKPSDFEAGGFGNDNTGDDDWNKGTNGDTGVSEDWNSGKPTSAAAADMW